MASPLLLGGLGIGASAGGGLLGAIGSLAGGKAQEAMYNYQSGVALLNKQIADQNASWAVQSGEISAEEKGLAGAQEIGNTKVAQAASGLDVNVGSAAAVRETQAKVSSYDQNLIRWNAAKTAYGYEAKGMADVAQSQIDISAGKQAVIAGDIGAGTSILGAASNVSSKWMQGKQIGIFS